MVERNELLPRVSNLIWFLIQEEIESIPRANLDAKAAEGTRKHKIIEDDYGISTDNVISWLFMKGLSKIFTPAELQEKPIFEEQLNGARFTGKPDFMLKNTLIDYKFTDKLRPTTALQKILYGMLEKEENGVEVERNYAFHYPEDFTLFIHKVPDRTVGPLTEYAEYLIENHEAIEAGELERYEALGMWDKLLEDYEMFEPVGAELLPPSNISNDDEAIAMTKLYFKMNEIIKYEKKLKSKLKQYMIETKQPKISDINGYGIQLAYGNKKLYNIGKKAAAKAVYDAAIEKCQTGTFETISLRRVSPRKKKVKQIN